MERITEIINDWDPIGFFSMAPKDEYINEIKKINEFVCSNYSLQVHTLAQEIKYLQKHLERMFMMKTWSNVQKLQKRILKVGME